MNRRGIRQRGVRIVALVAASVVGLAVPLVAAVPAFAASSLTVTSTADSDANQACDIPSVTVVASPVTLRNAVCVANNLGGQVTIAVNPGTYTLTSGALLVGTRAGADVTIVGGSSSSVVINGDGSHQIMSLDPDIVGNVAVSLTGLTLSGGVDNVFGGGAIIGGSSDKPLRDRLVVTASTFTGNRANTTADVTNSPGGAIQFIGGNLSVVNSVFRSNSSGASAGGAIAYQATGAAPGEGLSISGSTFDQNSTKTIDPALNGGGAVVIDDLGTGTPMAITDSVFSANSSTGSAANPPRGAALWQRSGTLTVTGSSFVNNSLSAGVPAAGAAVQLDGGSLTAHYNRFTGNAGGAALFAPHGTVNATQNWWGCPTGPGTTGCDTFSSTAAPTFAPYLTLHVSATPSLIQPPATTTTVTVDLLKDSAGGALTGQNLSAFSGVPVTWTSSPAGRVSPTSGTLSGGAAATTFTAGGGSGSATVTATLDGGSATASFGVAEAPAFTSAAQATFVVGVNNSVTISTDGYPAATIARTGDALPTGLAFLDNGNGTATLSGTAAVGTAKDYALSLSAANQFSTATQAFTLHVVQKSAITSANATSFAAGVQGDFTVVATGVPIPTPITRTGALPSGVTFTDNGNGTASLRGTPAAGTGGSYPLTFTATNGIGAAATQSFTLTVTEPPSITSAATATFTAGTAGSFTVTTAAGYPTARTLPTPTGLPSGVTFTDNGDGTATIAGTPAAQSGGSYPLVVTAVNGSLPNASQSFVLTVNEAPVLTTPASTQTVNSGNPASFTAVASGFPLPTVQWAVSTDGGTNFTPLVGKTSTTLSFTATQGDDGNRYRATFTNSAGSISSIATLNVVTAPTITSSAATTFRVGGGNQSFTITTSGAPTAALPTPTGLPAWLTFVDHGDGAATLSGTPPTGSGNLYSIALTATSGASPIATQTLALTVTEAPAITAGQTVPLSVGTAAAFTVSRTGGYPLATTFSSTGTLPLGVTFTDNRDGTATFGGTPRSGTGGSYPVTVTASNGTNSTVDETFSLVVGEPMAFSSAATTSLIRGVDGTFRITTGHSFPAVTTITSTGALPAGVSLTDNGDGTATLAGSSLDAAGAFPLTLTASNGTQTVTQSFTLVLQTAAVVPLPLLATPLGSGHLGGVPAQVAPGQVLTVTVDGYAPEAPIVIGIYSIPTTLGTGVADAAGKASITITIPAGFSGAHSIVSAGVGSDGADRFLRSDTTVVVPAAAGGSGGAGNGAVAFTGPGEDVSMLALVGLFLLVIGSLALLRRRRA